MASRFLPQKIIPSRLSKLSQHGQGQDENRPKSVCTFSQRTGSIYSKNRTGAKNKLTAKLISDLEDIAIASRGGEMPAYGNIDPPKAADADQLSRPKSMISQRIGDYKNIMNTNRKLEEASFTNG